MTAKVAAIFNGNSFDTSTSSTEALVGLLLDKTNFYAEEGGQVADQGYITNDMVSCCSVVSKNRSSDVF